ncbi:MAG: hypothetical protein JXM79_05690 [Sedimentisphaerales bacterium]|nr:hypothetical protein [Sedimentisphaerales bacterium]
MNIRTVLTIILGITFILGMSSAQESASPEPALEEPLLVEAMSPGPQQEEPTSVGFPSSEPRRGKSISRSGSSNGERMMKIFTIKYYSAEALENLIESIFSIDDEKIHGDDRSNQLIVQATKNQMEDIEALVAQLDVPDSKRESSQSFENFVYRVFMFEIPSKDQNLKPFSMILQASAQVTSATILGIAAKEEIEISDYAIIDEGDNGKVDILLQGKAPSNESIQNIAELTGIQIKELKWDDEMFTRNIAAAHYSQLPAQIQKHIQKFLGDDIVTVGYWFGSSSVPGEVEAPIGPWRLQLELNPESDRTLELYVEVQVPEERAHFDRQLGHERSDEILSNKIRAKIGKPIIIGYNRQSYGTRNMGAMVIIPEAETIQLNTPEPAKP